MYLVTLSKHAHVNSNKLMITVYKIHYLIQSKNMTCVSLSRSTILSLVDPMISDNLDTNIIAHYMNLIIMISLILCYISWTPLIQLNIYINSIYEYQINKDVYHIK